MTQTLFASRVRYGREEMARAQKKHSEEMARAMARAREKQMIDAEDAGRHFLETTRIKTSHSIPTVESVERLKTLNDLEVAEEDDFHWDKHCEEYLVTEFTYGFETLYWTWSKYTSYEIEKVREKETSKQVRHWKYDTVDLASRFLHRSQEQDILVTAPDGHTVSAHQDELMLSNSHFKTRWARLTDLAQRHVLRTLILDRQQLQQWTEQKRGCEELRHHEAAVLDSFHRVHLQATWKQIVLMLFDAAADAAHYQPSSKPEFSELHHRTIGTQGIFRQIHDHFFEHLIRRRYDAVCGRCDTRETGDNRAANWAADIESKTASDLLTVIDAAADGKPKSAYKNLAKHTIEYLLQRHSVDTSSKVKSDSWKRYLQNHIYTHDWREIETDTADQLPWGLRALERMYDREELLEPERLTKSCPPFPTIEADFVYHATRLAMHEAKEGPDRDSDRKYRTTLTTSIREHHTLLAWEEYRSEELKETLQQAQVMCAVPTEHSTTMDPPRSRIQLAFSRLRPASHCERLDVKKLEALSEQATEIARHLVQQRQDRHQAHPHHETQVHRADENHQSHQRAASTSSSAHPTPHLHPDAHARSSHSDPTSPRAGLGPNLHVLQKRRQISRSPSPTAKKLQGEQR